MELEFTTTACNRPELLEKTYKSFTSNLLGINYKKSTLYINIDPVPTKENIENIENICKKYFGNVVINYSNTPNFANAVIWCFSQIKGDIFFHLEDDWVLNKKVNMKNILDFITNKKIYNWHQCIFEKKIINQPNEPSLLPSLHNTKITKYFLKHMTNKENPEAQLKIFYRNIRKKQKIIFNYIIWDRGLVSDIGRNWLLKNNIQRNYQEMRKDKNKKKWSPWIRWDLSNYKK